MKTEIAGILLMITGSLHAQTFTKITNGPFATDTPTGGYAGVSWVDYDSDGDQDLFISKDFLYRNNGDGTFSKVSNSGITGTSTGLNNGNAWGDVDNDGDPDLVLVNQSSNGLFLNQGDGTFEKVNSGDIATNLNAWSATWADYNNDGWLDLVATHPCGFIGTCRTNWLFANDGAGTLESVSGTDVSSSIAGHTVANWTDYDDDGDMDLFIGSGEVGFTSRDHIYINKLKETGTAELVRTQTGVLFGDNRDGQNWNFIDYDNDGDLDAFVTNFKQDVPNDFYANNGDGSFTKLTDDDLGVHMVGEQGTWLANTWGDFNNDGWIDVVITADFGSPVGNHMYLNNGDGTFRHHFPAFANLIGSRTVANADYDNDGDLDVFINATQATFRGLFRNDLTNGDDTHWLNVTLTGTESNRSAIGASVFVKAMIDGKSVWQRREVSSQNAFCGHNSFRLHFGLGDATLVDSLVIHWPLGQQEAYTDLKPDQFLQITEGKTTSARHVNADSLNVRLYPNPAVDMLTLIVASADCGNTTVKIYDQSLIQQYLNITRAEADNGCAYYLDTALLKSGIYHLIIQTAQNSTSHPLIIMK